MYIPLHVHSQFSILNSTVSIPKLVQKAKEQGLSHLALTDEGNLYGAVDFYKACQKEGIQPILGCKIWVALQSRLEKKKMPGMPNGLSVLLLAKNHKGYQNLCKLSSIGFLEGFYYKPRIDEEVLAQHREGLICISEHLQGPVAYAMLKDRDPQEVIAFYQSLFGEDFYCEIQRHPLEIDSLSHEENWVVQKMQDYQKKQTLLVDSAISLAKKGVVPVVATSAIHYLEPQDWRAHEILLNVQSGEPCEIWERDSRGNLKNKVPNPKRDTFPTRELYFKTSQEIQTLFSDIPEAIEATQQIAQKCVCELDFQTKHYPVFIPPSLKESNYTKEERLKAAETFLYELCEREIPHRYSPEILQHVARKIPGKDPLKVVRDRFEYEFHLLSSKGMCDYMLIVYDFISWAKKRKIPMGPGRGSAAGSIIAYLTGITDIEPLRFDLFFERFINPERVSYPDIDVDICMHRRQEVIDYVVEKYGKEKVAQIITFGTMKAKMAIRDVGRVLNVALSKVNELASLIPEDPGMTLEKAMQIEPELASRMESDPEARQILEMARKAEGSIRNTSTHAAGLIISANPVTDHVPVCTAKDSEMMVTQYAMKPLESVGMLKIDFLGLKTLTSIQKCTDAIAARYQKTLDWVNLPLDDAATFRLLNQGKTLGVFQLESGGMQDLARQLHIDTFEEIIAVGALYRPGPMDMIPSFIQRKHGKETIEIDHPLMKDILAETYGVMVYQEQVMQIASQLANYTLGEGDVLRRAMGKKDREEMARQKQKFVDGCAQKEIPSEIAEGIFSKIEKFASYGFNKSHAAAYAYLSYVTAYLKANYPGEWMAALMTCDSDDTTKLAKFIGEAKGMQIPILPPDINEAKAEFVATPDGIRFAMSGIKGVGHGVVEEILEKRGQGGAYQSLYEFIQRVNKQRIGKKQIETLIDAGCFDFTKWSRDQLRESVEEMYTHASRDQKEASLGVLNLFSLIEESNPPFDQPPSPQKVSSLSQIYQKEKELLGFYLTGHPMEVYQSTLSRLSCVPFQEWSALPEGSFFRAAFVVEKVSVKISNKTQKKFAILLIGDGIERYELPIWSDLFEEKAALLKENQLLYGILQAERKETTIQLSCRYLADLTQINEEELKRCEEVYDRLKSQTRFVSDERKKKREKMPNIEKKPSSLLKIFCDASSIRFSALLSLKEIFRTHPGDSPVQMTFQVPRQKPVLLLIDKQWGVNLEGEGLKKLEEWARKNGSWIEGSS